MTTKREDNKFHVEGKLTVATKDEIKEVVGTVVPALKAGGDCRKILLCPVAHYWRSLCCNQSLRFQIPEGTGRLHVQDQEIPLGLCPHEENELVRGVLP